MIKSNEATIEQMNREIFDFMGCVHSQHCDMDAWEMSKLKYHTSWDALMPVVDRINTLKAYYIDTKELSMASQISVTMGVNGYFRNAHCIICGSLTFFGREFKAKPVDIPMIAVHDKKSLADAVYEAVYQFIQWYNNQTTTNE